MAIPKVKEQDILNALKYVDEHDAPDKNKSTKYELVTEDGKKYPPKYVIAIADHLANGTDIATEGYNAVEAKNFLQGKGFRIETKQEKYELTITADTVISTDECFALGNLGLGDNYKSLDVYFKKADGSIIRRNYNKGERRNSNQTMSRIACQIYENQIAAMSVEERKNFPVCQYTTEGETNNRSRE